MKIIKILTVIVIGFFSISISCKKQSEPVTPKVSNCIEAICIYKQTCGSSAFPIIYFKLIDTTQFKGSKILKADLKLLPNLNMSVIKEADRGFIAFYKYGGIFDDFFAKATVGRKYYFEYEILNPRIDFGLNFKCGILTNDWEEVQIKDTLTSKCARVK